MDAIHHKYQSDDRDDRSSTEVEESLMGDEHKWRDVDLGRPTRKTRMSRFTAILRSMSGVVNTLLLLGIFGLLLRNQFREESKKPLNTWQIGGDMTDVAPECEHDQVETMEGQEVLTRLRSLPADYNLSARRIVCADEYIGVLHKGGRAEVEQVVS
jgi:hypothetical protein